MIDNLLEAMETCSKAMDEQHIPIIGRWVKIPVGILNSPYRAYVPFTEDTMWVLRGIDDDCVTYESIGGVG